MPLPLFGVEKAWSIDRRCSSVPVSILLLLGLLVGTHGGGAAALSPIQCDSDKWLYVGGNTACRAVAEEMEKLPGVDSEIECVSKSFLEHDVLMFPSSVFFSSFFFLSIMIHPTSIILYHHVCRSSSIIMLYQYE